MLSHPPRVLTPEQRDFYFEQGYLHLQDFVSPDWIARLQRASARLVEQSRPLTESNEMFVLDRGHCAQAPRLLRLNPRGRLRPGVLGIRVGVVTPRPRGGPHRPRRQVP